MNEDEAAPADDVDPLREAAADVLTDVVAHAQLEPLLRRLLAEPAGTWLDIKAAAVGFSRLQSRLAVIDKHAASPLVGSWLELPASSLNTGYCLILFLIEEPLWTGSALLRRAPSPQASPER